MLLKTLPGSPKFMSIIFESPSKFICTMILLTIGWVTLLSSDCQLPFFGVWSKLKIGNTHIPIAVYKNNDIVSSNILRTGSWEPKISRFLIESTRLSFVDVGANIGTHSITAAYHGKNVIAIEPMINNILLLNATLCRTPILANKITLLQYGVGNTDSICKLYSDPHNVGDNHLVCDDHFENLFRRKKYVYRQSVPVKPLNSLVKPHQYDSLKIDVEGKECDVIANLPTLPLRTVAEIRERNSAKCLIDKAKKQNCRYITTPSNILIRCPP